MRVRSKIHINSGDACTSPGKEAGMLFPKENQKKKRIHHPKSIMHDKESRTCYLCMLLDGNHKKHIVLHRHHIFGGPNRIHSEESGLTIYLCPEHHLYGKLAVHNCKETMKLMHKLGQQAYEQEHTRQEFVKLFGKNYL